MSEIFNLRNIEFFYLKNQPAVADINFSVHEGEILSIIGSNGSGKSTLLHLLCGLIHPSKGEITFRGEIINESKLKDAAYNKMFRSSIGYVFQNSDAQLFCPTVMDEMLFGPIQLGLEKNIAIQRAYEIMHMLNIAELKDRPVYMLSGGEKKRVAIASILTTNPEILIFDEPMSGLDPKTRSFIIELIYTLNKAGKTIIIATHHLELVNHFESRVIVLSEHHGIEKIGDSKEILSDNELLIRANLIGEYPHVHDGTIHKHLSKGVFFHSHHKHS